MPSITDTILTERRAGTDKATIIKMLLANGYSVAEINAAFNALDTGTVPPPMPGAGGALPPPAAPPPPVTQPPAASPSSWFARFNRKNLLALAVLALVIGIATGTAYAYIEGIGPFSNAPYSENDFLTGLLRNSADIRSAAYEVAFTLSVGERDADAVPFVPPEDPNAAVTAAAYARDVERMREANAILSNLRITKPYPATLSALTPRYGTLDITDPNGSAYGYQVIKNGTDFGLSIAFETSAAIQAVAKSVKAPSTTTTIQGKTVTFSETSRTVYLSSKMPKTSFEQLTDMVKSLPAEMTATVSLGGTTNFGAEQTDWTFNVAGSGDFGDLTYALDVDVLKKDATYYFRINKIPSLFLGALDLAKGEWVKIEEGATTTRSLIPLPSIESSYKEERAQIGKLLYDLATIAEEEGLLSFRNAPRQETVDGRTLYRYDLRLAKDAIEPFNTRARELLQSGKYSAFIPYVSPAGAADSTTPEVEQALYDYYDKNVRLVVWVDADGRPAIVQTTMRVVPDDDAKQLAGKQVNIEAKLTLDHINEPVVIEAPADAKPLEEVLPKPSSSQSSFYVTP